MMLLRDTTTCTVLHMVSGMVCELKHDVTTLLAIKFQLWQVEKARNKVMNWLMTEGQ